MLWHKVVLRDVHLEVIEEEELNFNRWVDFNLFLALGGDVSHDHEGSVATGAQGVDDNLFDVIGWDFWVGVWAVIFKHPEDADVLFLDDVHVIFGLFCKQLVFWVKFTSSSTLIALAIFRVNLQLLCLERVQSQIQIFVTDFVASIHKHCLECFVSSEYFTNVSHIVNN